MDQIEEIKAKVDIVNLIAESIPLKKAGRNFKANCPFHSEKTASFMVSPEMQIFKCFGCGIGGDAIKFLQLYEKMDFWEAVEFLAKRTGVKLIHRQLTKDDLFKNKLYQINGLISEFYHFLLTKHKIGEKAMDYLSSRGIGRQMIDQFKLGFAPEGTDAIAGLLDKKGFSKEEIENSGLVLPRGSDYRDRFFGRIIFPLFNHRGLVAGFSGRLIPGVSSSEGPKYINSPETQIYRKSENLYGLWLTKQEIRETKKAIVVEGEFDVISAYQKGLKNTVAIKGTAFTGEQAKLITRFAETAILALDTDSAGSEAIKRSSQIADAVGLDVRVAALPKEFKDLDELVRNKPKLLEKVFSKTTPVWDFLISLSLKKNDAGDPAGKKQILSETLPFLIQIENEVIKNFYFQKLADVLGVGLESVLIEAGKAKTARSVFPGLTPMAKQPASRRDLLERQLLISIFAAGDWLRFKDKSWFGLVSDPLLKRIVALAGKFVKKEKEPEIASFLAALPAELKNGFEEIYFKSAEAGLGSTDKEIKKVLVEIEKESLRDRLFELSGLISQMEKQGEKKKIKKLENDFVEIGHKLSVLENE